MYIYISLFNHKFYYDYVHFSQTCLFGREKYDAGVHWTPRDYSRVKMCIIVNHMFRLIIVTIHRENVDTVKHFGIEYTFMSAAFLMLAMIISRNVPEK